MTPEERFALTGSRPAGMIPIREGLAHPELITPELIEFFDGAPLPDPVGSAAEPFVGITADGTPRPGLSVLADDGFDAAPAARAARSFLATLDDGQRARAQFPMSAPEWRMWNNAFPMVGDDRNGIWLLKATEHQRDAAMAVVEATLSLHGYRLTRDVMRLNAWLGEFIQQYLDSLTEWTYLFAIYGEPDSGDPWGWQLSGHHLDINCAIIGRQLVLTPTFIGAEPVFAPDGTRVLHEERAVGFQMFDALTTAQRSTATLHRSIRKADLPKALGGPIDGRHLGGAGQDNRVIPYAGVRGDQLTPGQRDALVQVTVPYLDRMPSGPRAAKLAAIERHLDETYFAWIGGDDPEGANYYRVHSPIVLIEYDNHPGIFLDNDDPEPFHIHTIVRTPNGGDYGIDLLAQHYAQHDHGHDRG